MTAVAGDILSSVWRDACRHIDIDESVGAIARSIAAYLPVRALAVLRVESEAKAIEPLAVGTPSAVPPLVMRGTTVAARPWRRLVAWLRGDELAGFGDAAAEGWLPDVLPEGITADVLAGPLRSEGGRTGILVFVAKSGKHFSMLDQQTMRGLLEPFTVAFENDARLHELRSLREAAEADRQTLLTRLGRQDINEEVVGSRTGLRHVMERAQLVAKSDVPVLILGETGTGKEVVSRAIHTRSERAEGPFIRVNCGAIPSELIDSQLFGHEKGSFTGAATQHQGWFERADRGTLFLDEIGELPLPAQVRLLRVLQEHQIERVGGKSPVHVDVRIVAATHRDLAAMVKERTFREDLWYRINVFPILLPRLRERLEDIPELARHFAQRAAIRFGLPYVDPTDDDLRRLASYHWPGNIRELGAVMDRAVILGGGQTLDVKAALGLSLQQPVGPWAPPEATLYEVIPESPPPMAAAGAVATGDIVPLAAAMKQHIERALIVTRGRIEGRQGAAALLQINPHTLRARMRKLGVDPEPFRS